MAALAAATPAAAAPAAPSDKNLDPSAAKQYYKNYEPLFTDSGEDSGEADSESDVDMNNHIPFHEVDEAQKDKQWAALRQVMSGLVEGDSDKLEKILRIVKKNIKYKPLHEYLGPDNFAARDTLAKSVYNLYNPAPVFGQWAAAPTLRF